MPYTLNSLLFLYCSRCRNCDFQNPKSVENLPDPDPLCDGRVSCLASPLAPVGSCRKQLSHSRCKKKYIYFSPGTKCISWNTAHKSFRTVSSQMTADITDGLISAMRRSTSTRWAGPPLGLSWLVTLRSFIQPVRSPPPPPTSPRLSGHNQLRFTEQVPLDSYVTSCSVPL